MYTSSPGRLKQTLGGVGRNIAEAAFRTGIKTLLVSVVGNDVSGKTVKDQIKEMGMVCAKKSINAIYTVLVAMVVDILMLYQDTKYLNCLPEQSTAVSNNSRSKENS